MRHRNLRLGLVRLIFRQYILGIIHTPGTRAVLRAARIR